jgi:hypothetical protein
MRTLNPQQFATAKIRIENLMFDLQYGSASGNVFGNSGQGGPVVSQNSGQFLQRGSSFPEGSYTQATQIPRPSVSTYDYDEHTILPLN